ncbi:MAG: exopolysaccharide biosynthesis protein [Alphaproteobacteria bacterium]|nr:exopolysaccharide biosynthesis protein [Alphaproteobacteria bacterium]
MTQKTTPTEPLTQVMTHLRGALTGAGAGLTMGALTETLGGRGVGLLLLLLALPMALPVPVPPGVNIALAAPLILLTAQQILGINTIWLPASLARRRVPAGLLVRALDAAVPWSMRLERVLAPRAAWATGQRGVGLAGLIMALAICVPVPFTNTIPAAGLVLMALGQITGDGLLVLLGAALGLAWVVVLVGAAAVGLTLLS